MRFSQQILFHIGHCEIFKYSSTLVEKVQKLAWEVAEKNEVLDFVLASFSKAGTALGEVNTFSDLARKRKEEMGKSLEESRKS